MQHAILHFITSAFADRAGVESQTWAMPNICLLKRNCTSGHNFGIMDSEKSRLGVQCVHRA